MAFLPALGIALGTGIAGGVGSRIGGKLGKILGFKDGGIVPGKPGQPRLALVHGGEMIIPQRTMKTVAKRSGQKVKLPVMRPKPKPKGKRKGKK